jgi:hypothetical protein
MLWAGRGLECVGSGSGFGFRLSGFELKWGRGQKGQCRRLLQKIPTSRKRREKWGTRGLDAAPGFAQAWTGEAPVATWAVLRAES